MYYRVKFKQVFLQWLSLFATKVQCFHRDYILFLKALPTSEIYPYL